MSSKRSASTNQFDSPDGIHILTTDTGHLQLVDMDGDFETEWLMCGQPADLREWV